LGKIEPKFAPESSNSSSGIPFISWGPQCRKDAFPGQNSLDHSRLPSTASDSLEIRARRHLNTHPILTSHRAAVRRDIPFRPVYELRRIASIRIISTAEFSLCRCLAIASQTPFADVCHIAVFRYSRTAKATPSSKNNDCLLTCLPRRGQGGCDRVSNQFRVHCLKHDLALLLTRLARASLYCIQSFRLVSWFVLWLLCCIRSRSNLVQLSH
jgi:hypothetical protein